MHYALWIPSLTQAVPEVVEEVVERELKDIAEFDACRFRSTADKSTCNIALEYSLTDNEAMKNITFVCRHKTDSGFLIYETVCDEEVDEVTEHLKREMHPSIYHLIKCHFHRHSFHDEECDTILRPYSSDSPIDVRNQPTMKRVFSFYLEQYQEKLQSLLTSLTVQYRQLKDLEKKDWFGTCLQQSKRIKGDSDKAAGEAAFAKALLMMSIATAGTHTNEKISGLAIDLENLSRRCTETYTVLNNQYNNRLGLLGIWVGVGGILLTTGLELSKCARKDTPEYETEYRILKQRADSLNEENRKALREFEKIRHRLEPAEGEGSK